MSLTSAARPAAVLALAVSMILVVSPESARSAPPALGFAAEICSLGSVVQGERADCTFSFANRGGDDLRIIEVEPSCGCTTALLSASVLHAGEGGQLRVVFDSTNYVGEIDKDIVVRANDPARPSVVLRVRAQVEPEIDFEPRLVSFDEARAGATQRQTVMLTNRRAEPVRLLKISSQPDAFGCRLAAWADQSQPLVLESWDRTAIEVTFAAPQALAMPVAGECALEVAGPRMRHFILKLLALPDR